MKKTVQLLLVIFTIIVCSSCSKLEMLLLGAKNPHLETKASLTKYMNKHQMDSTITLVAKDTVCFEKLNNYLADLAAILIYNKDGYLNIYADKRYCAGPVENYIGKICTAAVLGVDSTKSEKELLSFVQPFTVVSANAPYTNPDFSIYFTWTKWLNKVNEPIFRWRALAEKQLNCKINIHYINFDQRAEHYGFSKRKRMSVEVHKNEKKTK